LHGFFARREWYNFAMNDPRPFDLTAPFAPAGSQPQAIEALCAGIEKGKTHQTLLGVTGSGKTFTMAGVIARMNRPALVMAHNKTLAAQLYAEFREFFPHNAVEYFVSYYDYYQPESYLPAKDQYIEKDVQINDKLEQMRLSATGALLSRRDVVVVASVSCIYSLGDPAEFRDQGFGAKVGETLPRRDLLRRLIGIQYQRNDLELLPGRFRVRGDTVDLIPGAGGNILRIELFGDTVERLAEIHPVDGRVVSEPEAAYVFPARHYVIDAGEKERALDSISRELEEHLPKLPPLEAHRLRQRTLYDLELIGEMGYCKGIENYSRHFDGRRPGEPPFCLLDFFPPDFLMFIDESHQTIPQLHAMYNGDRSRKQSLIEYGFRLPSALDNRPLQFAEFERYMHQVVFVSATPAEYERQLSGEVVEQIVRPTGLIDPPVEVRPIAGQIADLKTELTRVIAAGERALVTTLTKKLAEELTDYLGREGIRARYLHSEIDTLERIEIIRQLRLGEFDVLVGINLLREGLDIPEVAFIAILDADKEGFLRDERSLIQIIGRAARNLHSKVVLYADQETMSIRRALIETGRRRDVQLEYNRVHGITPRTVIRPVGQAETVVRDVKGIPRSEIPRQIVMLETEMRAAAERLDFEAAIEARDQIRRLRERLEDKGAS